MLKNLRKTKDNSITVQESTKLLALLILPISLIILSLTLDNINNIYVGILNIVKHPDILITDYLKIGGLGSAFLNSAILTLVNIYILWRYKVKINGPSMSALFTVAGFAFFGKNIFNVWPIYLGGYLYSKYQKQNFKTVVIISMFGTALSPLITEIIYGTDLPMYLGFIVGIVIGVLVGFVLPPLTTQFLRTHNGYSLYNIGFTAGFIGTVVMSIMRSYGFLRESKHILSIEYDTLLKIFLTSYFIILIIIGYYLNQKSFKGYKDLLWYPGRLITDFTQLVGFGITLINMGIMGLIGILYVIISGGTINGPIIGGLLTMVGFASFGKHPKNSIPILMGVFLGGLTKIWDSSSTTVIISGLFGTTLAPIAGEYGWLFGILAGFLNLSVVMNVGSLHGGINLYNNGFSGGIVASILVPIIDAFKKEDN